jgi:hypothetical protein
VGVLPMELTPMLDQIRAAGVQLDVSAGKLTYRAPPGVLTAKRKAWLERHASELVDLLRPASGSELINWTERPDVITVVDDMFRARWHPQRISRTLGLTADEVLTILRRPPDAQPLEPPFQADVACARGHTRESSNAA